MDYGFVVGLIVIALVLWWLLYGKPAAEFIIVIHDGAAQLKDGTATAPLLQELTEQCLAAGIKNSEVRGIAWGQQIRLWFPKEFPPDVRQRLHNWWAIHGWRRGKLRGERAR
jgi:hypothetical protein